MVRGVAGSEIVIPVLFLVWLSMSLLLFFSLFRFLGFSFAHRLEETFFSAAASLGWISLSTVTLGLFGLARPVSLYAAALATGVAAAPLVKKALRGPFPPPVPAPAAYAACAGFLVVVPLLFLPPFFFDTLRNHYALPSLYLRSGFTWPLPHFVESNLPLGIEMLSMIGMAGASYFGAHVVNFLLFVLCGIGILCLAGRLGSRLAGPVGLLLFLFSSTSIHVLFFQKTDFGVTLFFFAFVYAIVAWLESGGDLRFLLLAAALAGLSLGTKYTTSLFVAVAFALALWERSRQGNAGASRLLREAAVFVAVAAAFVAPWLARNAAATGNPVYPLLNGIFRSPSWSPARMAMLSGDAHPALAQLHGWQDVAALFKSVTFFPDAALNGPGASLGLGIVAAFLFPAFSRGADRRWRYLGTLSLALFGAWFLSSWFSRYLLPALPLMALLAGFLGDRLAATLGGRRGTAAVAAVVACAVAAQLASTIAQSPVHKAWTAAFALPGHPERRAQVVARFHPSFEAVLFANASLPENARILFLGETRVYYHRRAVDAPSPYDEHPIAAIAAQGPDAETIRKRLAGEGYTHILVCWPEWERLCAQYYSRLWRKGEAEAAERFVRQLPAVFSGRTSAIYTLEAR